MCSGLSLDLSLDATISCWSLFMDLTAQAICSCQSFIINPPLLKSLQIDNLITQITGRYLMWRHADPI